VKGKRGRARRQPHSGGGDAAARGPSDALESSGFSPSVGAFALLALSGGWSPLPPGLYRFVRVPSSGRLEVVAGSPPAGSLLPEALVPPAAEAPAGWYLERRGAAGEEPGEALRAMALWSDPGEVARLPRIAALDRGGIRRYSLPGEGIVRLVGGRAFESSAAGIRVRALDAEAAGRGERFALALAVDSPDARASVLAAARPDELEPVVRGIAEKLALLPGLAEPERRAFARAAVVLRTLRGCSASTLEVGAGNSFVRLIPCSEGVLDRGQSR